MIHYNFPHRGAFDYDKFLITTLSYHNEVTAIQKEIENGILLDALSVQAHVNEVYAQYEENEEARKILYLLEAIS